MKIEAAKALGNLKNHKAEKSLVAAFESDNFELSKIAGIALAKMNMAMPIVAGLVSEKVITRKAANEALNYLEKKSLHSIINNKKIKKVLIEKLVSENGETRKVAAEAFNLLGENNFSSLISGAESDINNLCACCDSEVIELIKSRYMNWSNCILWANAVEGLYKINKLGMTRSQAYISKLYEKNENISNESAIEMKEIAAKMLGKLKERNAIEALVAAVNIIPKESISALAKLDAYDVLIDLLNKNDGNYPTIARAIASFKNSSSIKHLVKGLVNGKDTIRLAAARALESLGDTRNCKLVKGQILDIDRIYKSNNKNVVDMLIIEVKRGGWGNRGRLQLAHAMNQNNDVIRAACFLDQVIKQATKEEIDQAVIEMLDIKRKPMFNESEFEKAKLNFYNDAAAIEFLSKLGKVEQYDPFAPGGGIYRQVFTIN